MLSSDALDALTRSQRQVVGCLQDQNLSVAETGQRLGISSVTVRRHLMDARGRLTESQVRMTVLAPQPCGSRGVRGGRRGVGAAQLSACGAGEPAARARR